KAGQKGCEQRPERDQGIDRKIRIGILLFAGNRILIQDDSVRAGSHRPETNGCQAVMMPMSLRESSQPPDGHAMKNIAMEEPFEECNEEMHPKKGQTESPESRVHARRPQFREEHFP